MGKYDIALKAVTAIYPLDYVKLVLKDFRGKVRAIDKEVAVQQLAISDLVLEVEEDAGPSYLILLEFKSGPERGALRQVLRYTVLHHGEDGPLVYPVIIYLTGENSALIEETYSMEIKGKQVIDFRPQIVKVWELDGEELLKEGYTGLIPLLPLTRYRRPAEEIINAAVERIKAEVKESRVQGELYTGLFVLGSLKVAPEKILAKLEVAKMQESPGYWYIFGLGEQEGKKEGKKEVARNLLLRGVDLDTIVRDTGLTREEIEGLKKELQ